MCSFTCSHLLKRLAIRMNRGTCAQNPTLPKFFQARNCNSITQDAIRWTCELSEYVLLCRISMAKLQGLPVKGLLCDITGVLVESRWVTLCITLHRESIWGCISEDITR